MDEDELLMRVAAGTDLPTALAATSLPNDVDRAPARSLRATTMVGLAAALALVAYRLLTAY